MAKTVDINKKSTTESFMEILGDTNKTALDEFAEILELDDAKFDAIYPMIRDNIIKGFEDDAFRTDLLQAYKNTPFINIEAERKAAEDAIENVKNAEDLSANKKELLIMILEKGTIAAIEIAENPREKIKVQIEKLNPNAKLPEYAHPTDAGADVFAVKETVIPAGETVLVGTGLKLAIPRGYEIQVRPRSGLSLKTDLRIANAPGTIDSSYRGELGIIMWNTGSDEYTIEAGDKIAQLIIAPTPMMVFEEATISDSTDRGEGGFGSTDA